ncbi:D-isomer specific 2-hydroxyacid dehydrogenase [Collybia nuda]|uniref:D-isomer specific 2-hydroxyacid dehydrogenase n=1 Tax=Collybia nuda TaxID=64659 RepID=A0A9P5Y4M3_9AGAR|nr:D-isomer specific 2-hydroxyacid dehydrogenase [Collybia nuda]
MALRVAILDDYQHVALTCADWSTVEKRISIDVFSDTIHDEDLLVQRLEAYHIICTMRERTKFTSKLLDRLPNLRLITTTGMRNQGIDIDFAKSKGIIVSGTGSGGNSTLEHIWALILSVARNIAVDDANIKSGSPLWQTSIPVGLSGKTLGLIGVGRLGSQTAKVAKAFNMRVIGWSPNLTPERASQAEVEFVRSKKQLLQQSDIVSLHLVLSQTTHHILSAGDIAIMKPSALLINTSRGPLIDEAALIDAVKKKSISGAGLDVYDLEPLPLEHPLRKIPGITLTPHTGYVNDSNYKVFWSETVENIAGFLNGTPRRELA